MRKLLLALGVIVLVCVLLLVAAIVSLNRIVAANRERILQRMQAALGRPVSVEHISVSVWQGLGIQLAGVQIANDPQFEGPFLTAQAITARVDLAPLLTGELSVSRIDITNPLIRIMCDAQGRWNYSSMLRHAAPSSSSDTASSDTSETAGSHASDALVAFVGQANIRNGVFEFVDQRVGGFPTIQATKVDLSMTDVSDRVPIHFALDAALEAPARNLQLTGAVGPLLDLSAVPLTVDGTIGPLGPQTLQIDALRMTAVIVPDALRVTSAAGRTMGGSFEVSGELPWQHSPASATGNVSGVDVARVMHVALPRVHLGISGIGAITGDLRSVGSTPQGLQQNLSGTVEVTIRNGAIGDFNIVKEVVGKIPTLPGLRSLISATVKPKYGHLFTESETRLDSLHGTFHVAEQRVRTDDLTIIASHYDVHAAGWVGFDGQIDMVGTLTMSEGFSNDVTSNTKEARRVLDSNGRLVIPFRLRGRLGKATPEPEIGRLIDSLTEGAASELVDKLFGSPQKKGSSGNVIEKGIRDLFGH